MKLYWSGVFPAITTQMHKDGSLDLDATAAHVEALIKSGAGGIVLQSSLGIVRPYSNSGWRTR